MLTSPGAHYTVHYTVEVRQGHWLSQLADSSIAVSWSLCQISSVASISHLGGSDRLSWYIFTSVSLYHLDHIQSLGSTVALMFGTLQCTGYTAVHKVTSLTPDGIYLHCLSNLLCGHMCVCFPPTPTSVSAAPTNPQLLCTS